MAKERPRALEHRDIVQPITDGDHFGGGDAVVFRDPINGRAFVDARRG